MRTTPATTAAPEPRPHVAPCPIRVLLVDDHQPLRRFLAEFLEEADDIVVVGECQDGDEVVDAAARTRPDVVLMDLCMPGTDGLEATRRLLDVQPLVRVVILTGSYSGASRREAERIGAVGFLMKGEAFDLSGYIRAVAGGGTAWT